MAARLGGLGGLYVCLSQAGQGLPLTTRNVDEATAREFEPILESQSMIFCKMYNLKTLIKLG